MLIKNVFYEVVGIIFTIHTEKKMCDLTGLLYNKAQVYCSPIFAWVYLASPRFDDLHLSSRPLTFLEDRVEISVFGILNAREMLHSVIIEV